MWSSVDLHKMVVKVAYFSACLKVRGAMEHPIGHFITPLYGEAKHPKGTLQ